MSIFEEASHPWPSRMRSVLRIVVAAVFISFGTMKLFNYPPMPPMPPGSPPITLMSEVGIAGVLETFGGLAMLLGLFTRPVAFVLAGEMAVAYFKYHAPTSFWPSSNNGIGALLYCWIFLYFAVAGAGAWSIDALIERRRLLATNRAVRR